MLFEVYTSHFAEHVSNRQASSGQCFSQPTQYDSTPYHRRSPNYYILTSRDPFNNQPSKHDIQAHAYKPNRQPKPSLPLSAQNIQIRSTRDRYRPSLQTISKRPPTIIMTIPTTTPTTHYEILNISPSFLDAQRDASRAIKRAYHRALLRHHPDKKQHTDKQTNLHLPNGSETLAPTTIPSSRPTSSSNSTLATEPIPASISVDRISEAYRILSDPASRAVYDKELKLRRKGTHQAGQREDFQTGIETLDLDDFNQDENETEADAGWYRSCRCGNDRGFSFTESDLELESDTGELVVGCQDCSLWIRVHFSVVDG